MNTDTRQGPGLPPRPSTSADDGARFGNHDTPADEPMAEDVYRLYRLTWSAPWWEPSTWPARRLFVRHHAAFRKARKLREVGYVVTVEVTRCGPWREVTS